jgi:UDP-N-acetylmuramoyl-L-alanyl-D-glutamate--2,6-diaminopimelate ligase
VRLDRLVERSLAGSDQLVSVSGDPTVEVASVTMDSRAVGPGTLFACVPGARADGHTFAPGAVSAGAVALLCERPLDLPVPQLIVSSVRRAVGPVAAAVHGDPSQSLVVAGVTGTNGKTTTTALLAAIFEAQGWSATALGTLTQARTTPEAPELQRRLAELAADGRRAVAMEVSSHALDQFRVEGVRFAAGVLTNVTQDHLDYHGTMERYFEAKARLFEPERTGVAIVNRDDPWGRRLIDKLAGGRPPVETFGIDDAHELEIRPGGSRFRWEGERVRLVLGGRFNVLNALAAARCAAALGVAPDAIAAGLGSVERVPGRFEAVDAGQPFSVLVDYAHTPDGLRQALTAARELTAERLIVVFGAGGDRDHDKRPLMGQVAASIADLVVITSDNPRSEDPGAIIQQVAAGAEDPDRVQRVPDRVEAIETAMWVAGPGDVVVIAGKGHETGQEVAGQYRPFDDVAVARESIARVLGRRRHGGPVPG